MVLEGNAVVAVDAADAAVEEAPELDGTGPH